MNLAKRTENVMADFEGIVAGAGVGLVHLDDHGRYIFANDCYCEMLGLSARDVLGRSFGESFGDASAVSPLMAAVRSGAVFHTDEIVLAMPGGKALPVACWVNPIVRDGVCRGTVCTIVDLTAYRQCDQVQHREIAHRVRNIFAIAQAIVGQTLRGIAAPREIAHILNQRLAALSGINTVMMRNRRDDLSIREVVDSAIAMHRFDPERVTSDGVDLAVGAKAALAMSLALHELCTNAAKFGALSDERGRVTLSWSVERPSRGEPTFKMKWREQFGPLVAQPTHKGVGMRLIVDSLSSDVRGRSELTFPPDGAQWTLEAPVRALAD